jgi:uncharacterized OB-fold protein
MSRMLRCRRCGVLFVPDGFAAMPHIRRFCPRCRGPLPPTGGVPASEGGRLFRCPPEAA